MISHCYCYIDPVDVVYCSACWCLSMASAWLGPVSGLQTRLGLLLITTTLEITASLAILTDIQTSADLQPSQARDLRSDGELPLRVRVDQVTVISLLCFMLRWIIVRLDKAQSQWRYNAVSFITVTKNAPDTIYLYNYPCCHTDW